jgi:hypothetical protein
MGGALGRCCFILPILITSERYTASWSILIIHCGFSLYVILQFIGQWMVAGLGRLYYPFLEHQLVVNIVMSGILL